MMKLYSVIGRQGSNPQFVTTIRAKTPAKMEETLREYYGPSYEVLRYDEVRHTLNQSSAWDRVLQWCYTQVRSAQAAFKAASRGTTWDNI